MILFSLTFSPSSTFVQVSQENLLEPDAGDEDTLQRFLNSEAFARYLRFIMRLNEAASDLSVSAGRKLLLSVNPDPASIFPLISGLLSLLERADRTIDACPPEQQPTRFGNKAFRTFCTHVRENVGTWLTECGLAQTSSSSSSSSAEENSQSSSSAPTVSSHQLAELSRYFYSCFGDSQRIDYGSGHELNFVCLLFCLSTLHQVSLPERVVEAATHISASSSSPLSSSSSTSSTSPLKSTGLSFRSTAASTSPSSPSLSAPSSSPSSSGPFTFANLHDASLVLQVFSKYIALCRRLQRTYWLEPVRVLSMCTQSFREILFETFAEFRVFVQLCVISFSTHLYFWPQSLVLFLCPDANRLSYFSCSS